MTRIDRKQEKTIQTSMALALAKSLQTGCAKPGPYYVVEALGTTQLSSLAVLNHYKWW